MLLDLPSGLNVDAGYCDTTKQFGLFVSPTDVNEVFLFVVSVAMTVGQSAQSTQVYCSDGSEDSILV